MTFSLTTIFSMQYPAGHRIKFDLFN